MSDHTNGASGTSDTNDTNDTNGDSHEEEIQLPSAKFIALTSSVTLQPPLTRRGHGPGLILLVPHGVDLSGSEKTLDPPPLQKWAEEGYAVAQIVTDQHGRVEPMFATQLRVAFQGLQRMEECDSVEQLGLICRSY
jgi:carboxymethylenebutenolidase